MDIDDRQYKMRAAREKALIQDAAPELLAACRAVAGVFEGCSDNDLPLYAYKCRQAIAKAEGRRT